MLILKRLSRFQYVTRMGKFTRMRRTLPGKTRIAISLDDEVLAWFREQVHLADGCNYQTLIDEALRQYIQQSSEPLEETLRRVVREELQRIEK